MAIKKLDIRKSTSKEVGDHRGRAREKNPIPKRKTHFLKNSQFVKY